MKKNNNKKTFLYSMFSRLSLKDGQSTLQILMLISIISFLSTLGTIYVLNAQKKTRDSERMTSITNLQKALDLYYDTYNEWPQGDDDGMGWDEGFHDKDDRYFIKPLIEKGFVLVTASDPKFFGNKSMKYNVYEAGYGGCNVEKGKFYVLGITDLETDIRTEISADENIKNKKKKFDGSGFSCKNRDWGKEFDYVVGKFEQ